MKAFLVTILLFAGAITPVVAAEAIRTETLTISWDHDDPNPATEFRVYKQSADGAWVMVKSVTGEPAPKTATITDVPAGVHTYRITAVGPWGESIPSAPTSTPAPATQPTRARVQILVQVSIAIP